MSRQCDDVVVDDHVLIEESLQVPERFGLLFDRHARAVHRYLARRLGPQADDLLAETFLVAFRRRAAYEPARVMAATAAPSPAWRHRLTRPFEAVRSFRSRGRLVVGAVAVTAAATVAAAVTAAAVVTVEPAEPADRPVTLVAFDTPTFPVALSPLPAGLSSPSFSGQSGTLTAVYRASPRANDVYLTVYPRRPDLGMTTPPKTVVIDGRQGQMYTEQMTDTGVDIIVLNWERKPGQWLSITGNGRFATEAKVLALADAVIDKPQRVPLQLGLAPSGWALDSFKDDTILTLRGAASEGSSATLSVQAVPRMDPRLAEKVRGEVRQVRTVTVNGHESQLIRTDESWLLQAPFPDGSAFILQTPLLLAAQQVIAIGEQVDKT